MHSPTSPLGDRWSRGFPSSFAHLPPTPTIPREGFTPPFIPPLDPTWGGENRGGPSYVALQSIFYTFNFLIFFKTLFISTNQPSWSQHVPFWCPTWPPKWGPNRWFLEFKSQLMLQQPKMSKFAPLSSENLVFPFPGPPKTLPNSTKNRS